MFSAKVVLFISVKTSLSMISDAIFGYILSWFISLV